MTLFGRSESRTIREARDAIHELEAALGRVQMSPAMALTRTRIPDWYLRKARLALRQADRQLAPADDPRLPVLKPLRAQIATERRVYVDANGEPVKRRKRFRCPVCFEESLRRESEKTACYKSACYGTVEPVARHRKAT